MARPRAYSPERAAIVLDAIRKGATYELAAAAAGISADTLAMWRKKMSGFSELMREAEGETALKWLKIIDDAAPIDWKAAAWKLERRYPKEYGKSVQEQEHTGGITVRVVYADDSDG